MQLQQYVIPAHQYRLYTPGIYVAFPVDAPRASLTVTEVRSGTVVGNVSTLNADSTIHLLSSNNVIANTNSPRVYRA